MSSLLRVILGIGAVLAVSSCSAHQTETPEAPDDLLSALSTGDHRLLDSLNPSRGAIEELRRSRLDGPYILGRALERRGRDAAAELVYEAEQAAGVSRWAGLSAVRLAHISRRRDDHPGAQGHAQNAVELVPEFRDGWMALGTALYRREEYRALLEFVGRFPPPEALSSGELVSSSELYAEAALWRAVSAWETRQQGEAAFRDAFIGESLGEIHERLFLYLFYRDNGSASFSPVVRLLMESVYRQERGESQEAVRLVTMIEPDALIRESLAAAHENPASWRQGAVAELGIWESLMAMARDGGDLTMDSWLRRVGDAALDRNEEELQNVGAMVQLIRAEAAVGRGASEQEITELFVDAGKIAESDELRRRIAGHLVEYGISRERPLSGVVDDLHQLSDELNGASFPDAYATAVERLLPPLVRERSWQEISLLLQRIPAEAQAARNRMLVVLVHAADAGLIPGGGADQTAWDAEFSTVVENLSAIGYTGMLGRVRAGLPPVEPDPASVDNDAGERALDLALGEALVMAGDARPALSVMMRAATDPRWAPEVIEIAALMAELGHTSDALDVARRAVSRAELPLTQEIIELIYPTPFRAELVAAAERHQVPVYVLAALVREESHFRPIARSPVGAQGLGQIMPSTANDIRRRMDWPEADVNRPADNLFMSAYYLDYLAGQIESPVLRLAAYNAGLGRGRRWQVAFGDLPPILQIEALPFVETRWYLRRILVSHAMYRERMLGEDVESGLAQFMEGDVW
jgi:soluble lytic murein transglycosylase-like protein